MKTVARLGWILAAWMTAPALHAQLLSVEQLSGASQLTRNGLTTALNLADPVVDQDRLLVGDGARLTLKFGTHGFVDLGPGAELLIESLPYASFADDLRTVLRLQKGYLRVVWNHPPAAARWPLFVLLGAHRLQLSSGEFFFETSAATSTACAASGQMVLTDSRASSTPLPDASCHRLGDGRPQATIYRANDWVAIRNNFSIRAPEALATATTTASPAAAPADGTRHPRVQIETLPALPPIAATPAVKSGTGVWVLNLASLSREADADRYAAQLRATGYPARVQAAQVNGLTRYRVQLSGYASRAEANTAADEIGEKLGILDIWASRD